jgi:hypothetical protein
MPVGRVSRDVSQAAQTSNPQSNFAFHDPSCVRYPFQQLWANVVLQALWRALVPPRRCRSAVTRGRDFPTLLTGFDDGSLFHGNR